MSSHAIVYASRARSTGALNLTIDTKHADVKDGKLPFKGPMVDNKFEGFGPVVELRKRTKDEATRRYAAVCLDHKQTAYFDDHYPAGRAIAWPQEWCTRCKALFESGAKVKVPAKATATVIEAKTPAKAPAKSGRAATKAANTAANRAARQQRKAGPVSSSTVPVTAGAAVATLEPDDSDEPRIIDVGDEPDDDEEEDEG